jgi:hypothetical protein
MHERILKVELYGQMTQEHEPEFRTQTELIVKNNEDGTKTFFVHCLSTGKLLIKFSRVKENNDNNDT